MIAGPTRGQSFCSAVLRGIDCSRRVSSARTIRCAKNGHSICRRDWSTNRAVTPVQPVPRAGEQMSDADVALVPEFEPPAREAWLGAGRQGAEGRPTSRSASSRARPTGWRCSRSTRAATRSKGLAPTVRTAYFPGGWDIRQRHAEPIPRPPTPRSWRTSTGGATSLLLQITAPGQAGLSYGAEALGGGAEGRVPGWLRRSRSMRARTPWMRPAA